MDNEAEEALRIAQESTAKLMELADSVRIFITRHNPITGKTQHVSWGAGNWFAQEGQIREWCMQNEERSRTEAHDSEE